MKLTRRDILIGGASAALIARPASADTQVIAGPAFGSSWRVVCAGGNTRAIRHSLNQVVARIDAEMSPYLPSSALSVFNASASDAWQDMPADLCSVAQAALALARFTDGAFDPTVGPAVNRMGFGPITGKSGAYTMVAARAQALRKAGPHLTLDLCGIAKGHALDRIVQALLSQGNAAFLVELGGEVRATGQHPAGRPWQVAIEDPWHPGFAAHRIVAPAGLALATSGHRANGLRGRVPTSHIINPQTNRPAISTVASVSVLEANAARADGLATALCAMGDDAPLFAKRHGISALFIAGPPNAPREILTGHFRDHLIV